MRIVGTAVALATAACAARAALLDDSRPYVGVYRGSAILVRGVGSDDVGQLYLNGASRMADEAATMIAFAYPGQRAALDTLIFASDDPARLVINGTYQFDPSLTLTAGGYLICLYPRDRYGLLFYEHGCLSEVFNLPNVLQP